MTSHRYEDFTKYPHMSWLNNYKMRNRELVKQPQWSVNWPMQCGTNSLCTLSFTNFTLRLCQWVIRMWGFIKVKMTMIVLSFCWHKQPVFYKLFFELFVSSNFIIFEDFISGKFLEIYKHKEGPHSMKER